MDEPTPPLAIFPAPKKKRPPKGGALDGAPKMLFVLLGVVLGSAVVLGTLHFASTPPPRVVYRSAAQPTANRAGPGQTTTTQGAPASVATPPGTSPAAGVNPAPGTTSAPGANTGAKAQVPTTTGPADKAKVGDKLKGKGKPDTNVGPYNPFDGTSSAMPPTEINGHIAPGPGVIQPDHPGTASAADEVTKGLLVTVRLDVSDPDSAVRALQAIAAKEGGAAIQFDEMATKADPEGAILFVPATKAGDTEKQLAGVGAIVVSDRWNGASGDRLDRVEKAASERLSDLHIRRQELLVRYFEDAPQIKHIDEDSQRINKSLAALRSHKPGSNTAVFKIKFLS